MKSAPYPSSPPPLTVAPRDPPQGCGRYVTRLTARRDGGPMPGSLTGSSLRSIEGVFTWVDARPNDIDRFGGFELSPRGLACRNLADFFGRTQMTRVMTLRQFNDGEERQSCSWIPKHSTGSNDKGTLNLLSSAASTDT